MILSEMQQLLKVYINDPGGSLYTKLQLTTLLNLSMQFVYNKLLEAKIYTKKAETTITFTTGIQETAFDPNTINIQKIIAVYDEDGVSIDIYSEEFSKKSDIRSVYYKAKTQLLGGAFISTIRSDKLGWYREPETTFTVTVIYAEKLIPLDVTASDVGNVEVNDIPSDYHHCIILRAAELAWAGKGISSEIRETILYYSSKFSEEFEALVNVADSHGDSQQSVVDLYT